MRNGIAVAGTVLVDKINVISAYPKSGNLTKILSVEKSTGGNIPNVGIDLKKICPSLPVYAIGKVGDDDDGRFIIKVLSDNGLDASGITVSKTQNTSFTDVMSVSGGERTFFTYMGACGEFGEKDIDFDNLNAKMLHLGYFLLLDKIDQGDGEKILKRAKELGIKTSIDVVSENSDRYKLVIPCLKYTDNLIINEIEASKIAGIEYNGKNVKEIAEKLISLGVKDRVIIHMPSYAVSLNSNGDYTVVPSLDIPKDFVKGTTGAGDAFCAGSLYSIYNGYSDKEILEFASMCAGVSLSTVDAVSGLTTKEEILDICKTFKRKIL